MLLFLGYSFVCRCLSGSGGCSSCLFTLAATHFTRVIRRATVAWGAGSRSCCNHYLNHFSCDNSFNRSWLCDHCSFDHGFSGYHFSGCRLCCSHWLWCGLNSGRLCNWLADKAGFLDRLRCFFDNRSLDHWRFCHGFDHWLWSSGNWLGNYLNFRLCFLNRCNLNFRRFDCFDRSHCFHNRGFCCRGFGNGYFYRSGLNNRCRGSRCFNSNHFLVRFNDGYGFSRGRFLSRFSGTFCLMVSLGFSWSADNLAGNDFSHGHGSGYF